MPSLVDDEVDVIEKHPTVFEVAKTVPSHEKHGKHTSDIKICDSRHEGILRDILESRGLNSSIERNSIRLYRYKMKTLVKEQVKRLLEQLPDDATWEDLQYAILIHQTVEAGAKVIVAGRFQTSEEVRERFKLSPRA